MGARLALIGAVMTLTLGVGPASAADYVALGDSIAAGYGLAGATSTPCSRSAAGYPGLVAERLGRHAATVRLRNLSCSGAVADGGEGMRSLRQQVGVALSGLRARPTLVSLTIGINDLEWWNVFRLAVLVREDRRDFEAWLSGAVDDVRRAIRRELRRLLARPQPRVVLTGYYNPLNRRSAFFASRLVCPDAAMCRRRAARVMERLDAAIRSAPTGLRGSGRVRFAPILDTFAGHESARPACGQAPPDAAATWIQGDCFHPNARGAAAIARAVDRAARKLGL